MYTDFPDIEQVDLAVLPELAALWEAAVRATHHFLSEEDISFFRRSVVDDYLPAATLFCIRENGIPKAFIGIKEREIETLFVHPDARRKGLGKFLLTFAINVFNADRVDVNEQNEQAVGFYLKMGFEIIDRDETDGYGKPFPILHLKLRK